MVSFRFDNAGARKFGRITQENVGKPFAIVLDDKVISAPRIREPILGGSGHHLRQLHGRIGQRAGRAPARRRPAGPLERWSRSARSVPSSAPTRSGPARSPASSPAVLVVALMLVYYGVFGLIADVALVLNVVLILGHHDPARRHADPARDRRDRADHRPGGRFQRPDLRADPRGARRAGGRRSRRSTPASARPCGPSSTPT